MGAGCWYIWIKYTCSQLQQDSSGRMWMALRCQLATSIYAFNHFNVDQMCKCYAQDIVQTKMITTHDMPFTA